MEWPETIDDLQFFVSRLNTSARVRFVVKILAILHFTKDHPEYISKVGGAWMGDGRHFIINSKIVGEFLDLRANSINTNFRDHGFIILTSETDKIRKQFPNLTDVHHWKMRMHPTEDFTSDSTLQSANELPFAPAIPQIEQTDKLIPKELSSFLTTDMVHSLYQIYNLLEPQDSENPIDEKSYSNLLLILFKVWKEKISQSPETDFNTAIDFFLSNETDLSEESKLQLEINLTFFLEQRDDCSQITNSFSFDSFVKLFIRFGCFSDYLQTLKEITYFVLSDFEPFTAPIISSDYDAKFVGWFSPYHRSEQYIPNPGDWICNPSKKINVFSLHLRQEDDTIISIHIYHNSTEEDQTKRYSVNFRDNVKYSPTLDIMFREILSLSYKNSKPNSHNSTTQIYVKYADSLVSKNEENTEQVNNDECPFEKFTHTFDDSQFALMNSQPVGDSQFIMFNSQSSQGTFGDSQI
ncbi:hypothetical protein GPJ56_003379 [Histomonas meleagridis]|uniref:uncharacterized protein n=1 Tax=Histomonas meleagridis TaxID=135588 RepID=UPI00355A7EBE|nr:hypothetical protein GPJ56_003379 [Histomonas meleagridis]KAH0804998.1 hypothetical protein GO595_001943 [Histomonas meleagridis]